MASEGWAEEKYGICDMKACKPEDGGQPRMELLRWFKGTGKKSSGRYRCAACYESAADMSSFSSWRNANEPELVDVRGEVKPAEIMQIYLRTGNKSIAVDVTPGCTIDIDKLISSSSGSRQTLTL